MRVLIGAATDFGAELFGGIASYVHDLTEEWRSTLDVTLLGISGVARKPDRIGPRKILLSSTVKLPSNRLALSSAILMNRRQLEGLAPDVLYAHSSEIGLAMSVASPGVPLVMHVHGTESTLRSSRFRLARSRLASATYGSFVQLPSFRRAASIIITADERRYVSFVDTLPSTIQRKCLRIPSMVNLKRYAAPVPDQGSAAPLRLISVGRLVPRKGFHTVLRAVAWLRERGGDVTLRIVGDGPERVALECLTAELGLSKTVTFVGFIPRERMCLQLSNAQIFVSGSVQEGFSMSMLESLASGVPVVGFDVGGLAEIACDGRSGAVSDEETPAGLARAIQSIVPVTTPMRMSCVAVAQRYSSVGIAGLIRSVLEDAAGARAGVTVVAP